MRYRPTFLFVLAVVLSGFARIGISAEPEKDNGSLKVEVIRLKSAPADVAVNLLTQAKIVKHVASDVRSNSVVLAGPEKELPAAKKFIEELEESWGKANPPQGNVVEPNMITASSFSSRLTNRNSSTPTSSQQKLAEQYRAAEEAGAKDQMEIVKRDLKQSVESDFEQRLQEDQGEVAGTRDRMDALEKSLKARIAAKEQIIENRLKEILQPEMQWNPPSNARNRLNFGGLQNLNPNQNPAQIFRGP